MREYLNLFCIIRKDSYRLVCFFNVARRLIQCWFHNISCGTSSCWENIFLPWGGGCNLKPWIYIYINKATNFGGCCHRFSCRLKFYLCLRRKVVDISDLYWINRLRSKIVWVCVERPTSACFLWGVKHQRWGVKH